MREIAYVYILSSTFKRLYIGVTSTIEDRISQHKNGAFPESFTSRYKIDQLVYLERFPSITSAIARKATEALVAHQENSPHRRPQPHLERPQRRLGETHAPLPGAPQ
jgi:predicted GIY-YIG superfamily endonuclease